MRSVDPFIREPFAQFVEARGDKAGSLDPLAGAPAFNFLTGRGGFAQASSHELGMLPEGAPTAPGGSLRVDLGKRLPISRITVRWTDALPSTFQVLVSDDGTNWTPTPPVGPDGTFQHPVKARHVRADLTRPAGEERVGIRELEVIRR